MSSVAFNLAMNNGMLNLGFLILDFRFDKFGTPDGVQV